ncbi:MAG: sugar phosphate isomerase/epimerase [Clostridia bacterium]|nr:sugar phosphate isomerase/epimerase [Clostridia bacterium]
MLALGMPTLIELPDIEDCAQLCRELGLQFVELSMCLPQYQPDRMDIPHMRDIADKYSIFYTVHLDDTNTPCDFNPRIAKAFTETVLETIGIAKQLSIPILNMHLSLGTYFTLPDRKVFLFEEYRDTYFDRLRTFRDACTKAIGNADIRICIENTSAFSHPIVEESLSCLLESPAFAVTFDTGHDAVRDFTQRRIIDRHIDRLCHMHLHDAIPADRCDHLPLGSGELPIADYLSLAQEHNCRTVIEVKTVDGLAQSLPYIKNLI